MLIPHDHTVDVISPINIFWPPFKRSTFVPVVLSLLTRNFAGVKLLTNCSGLVVVLIVTLQS